MILMRHGETDFNVIYGATRRDPGIEDPALTRNGRSQIVAAVDQLHDLEVRSLIASPYRRAVETAEIVATALGVPVTIEADVRERFAFSCDIGTPMSALAFRWREFAFDHLDEIWWPPTEEPEHALHDRCRRFSGRMAASGDWTGTLVVTHWGVIRALTGRRIKNGEMLRFDPVTGSSEELPGGGRGCQSA